MKKKKEEKKSWQTFKKFRFHPSFRSNGGGFESKIKSNKVVSKVLIKANKWKQFIGAMHHKCFTTLKMFEECLLRLLSLFCFVHCMESYEDECDYRNFHGSTRVRFFGFRRKEKVNNNSQVLANGKTTKRILSICLIKL